MIYERKEIIKLDFIGFIVRYRHNLIQNPVNIIKEDKKRKEEQHRVC